MSPRLRTGYRNMWLVASLLVCCVPAAAKAQHVEFKTQKDSYRAGEKIALEIRNISNESVYTIAASSRPEMGLTNIERKASVGWDALPLRCRQPSCTVNYTMPSPAEIFAGKRAVFSWKPVILEDNKYVSPGPGAYRVTIMYRVKKDSDPSVWNWKTVRSNTFTLE